MTLAVLVLAPESSGNRLMTRLLIAAGCYGDAHEVQRLDDGIPPADGTPIVWLRSFPHNRTWANIPDMTDTLRFQGYDVKAVTLFRDWYAQRASQQNAGHVRSDAEAQQRIREAYVRIFEGIARAGLTQDYVPVVYSALVAHPVEVLTDLLKALGLPTWSVAKSAQTIHDANDKYYPCDPRANGHSPDLEMTSLKHKHKER